MKTFKQIAEEYQESIDEGAKLKKIRKWVPDEKGNLKKVLKKICVDSEGQRAKGFKLINGKKCEKMTPQELKIKKMASKKILKTKKKNAKKNEKRAEKIAKKKEAKGL